MPNIIWAKNFIEVGQALTELIDVKERRTVYNIWTELVDHTPVCSGKAAYSWFVSPNSPITKDRLPAPPIPDDECVRIYVDPRSEGRYRGGPKVYFPEYTRNYTKWFINNPVDYIGDLNDGKSDKAPMGFIQQAITSAIKT